MKFDKVFFKGKVIKRKDFLAYPEKYPTVICLEVDTDWWYPVINFGKMGELDNLAIKIERWEEGFKEQARRFYFAVRDRLTEAMGDTSRHHKDHLHKEAKKECGLYHDNGTLKSFNELNKREVWLLTEVMLRWAEEAGAYIDDLVPMHRYLGHIGGVHGEENEKNKKNS